MKHFFTVIILLLANSNLNAQTETSYPFEYRLNLHDTLDTAPVLINTLVLESKTIYFSGKIINSLLSPVIYARINAKRKDSTFMFFSDDKGYFSYSLLPGEYNITISSLQYTSASFTFVWKGFTEFEYLINLSKKPYGGIYNVSSKIKLDQPVLNKIKECLWNNLRSPTKCNKKNVYHIMGEL